MRSRKGLWQRHRSPLDGDRHTTYKHYHPEHTWPSRRKLSTAAKCRPSRSTKTLPSPPLGTTLCRPLNMALKRDGAGALRSVVIVVVKRWPPTLSVIWGGGGGNAWKGGEGAHDVERHLEGEKGKGKGAHDVERHLGGRRGAHGRGERGRMTLSVTWGGGGSGERAHGGPRLAQGGG